MEITFSSVPLCIQTICYLMITLLSATSSYGRIDDRKTQSLQCYYCHTLTDGEICHKGNYSAEERFRTHRCLADEIYCMVRRFSFSANGTDLKVWIMERNCSKMCINECVITGDRSKLHLCTSCCQKDRCNEGNGASTFSIIDAYIVSCLALIAVIYVMLLKNHIAL